MTKIDFDEGKKTFSAAIVLGLFAAPLAPTCFAGAPYHLENRLWPDIYHPGGISITNSGSRRLDYNRKFDRLEDEVGTFFAQLVASQEPLGAEFEKVLHDNLWDLYES